MTDPYEERLRAAASYRWTKGVSREDAAKAFDVEPESLPWAARGPSYDDELKTFLLWAAIVVADLFGAMLLAMLIFKK